MMDFDCFAHMMQRKKKFSLVITQESDGTSDLEIQMPVSGRSKHFSRMRPSQIITMNKMRKRASKFIKSESLTSMSDIISALLPFTDRQFCKTQFAIELLTLHKNPQKSISLILRLLDDQWRSMKSDIDSFNEKLNQDLLQSWLLTNIFKNIPALTHGKRRIFSSSMKSSFFKHSLNITSIKPFPTIEFTPHLATTLPFSKLPHIEQIIYSRNCCVGWNWTFAEQLLFLICFYFFDNNLQAYRPFFLRLWKVLGRCKKILECIRNAIQFNIPLQALAESIIFEFSPTKHSYKTIPTVINALEPLVNVVRNSEAQGCIISHDFNNDFCAFKQFPKQNSSDSTIPSTTIDSTPHKESSIPSDNASDAVPCGISDSEPIPSVIPHGHPLPLPSSLHPFVSSLSLPPPSFAPSTSFPSLPIFYSFFSHPYLFSDSLISRIRRIMGVRVWEDVLCTREVLWMWSKRGLEKKGEREEYTMRSWCNYQESPSKDKGKDSGSNPSVGASKKGGESSSIPSDNASDAVPCGISDSEPIPSVIPHGHPLPLPSSLHPFVSSLSLPPPSFAPSTSFPSLPIFYSFFSHPYLFSDSLISRIRRIMGVRVWEDVLCTREVLWMWSKRGLEKKGEREEYTMRSWCNYQESPSKDKGKDSGSNPSVGASKKGGESSSVDSGSGKKKQSRTNIKRKYTPPFHVSVSPSSSSSLPALPHPLDMLIEDIELILAVCGKRRGWQCLWSSLTSSDPDRSLVSAAFVDDEVVMVDPNIFSFSPRPISDITMFLRCHKPVMTRLCASIEDEISKSSTQRVIQKEEAEMKRMTERIKREENRKKREEKLQKEEERLKRKAEEKKRREERRKQRKAEVKIEAIKRKEREKEEEILREQQRLLAEQEMLQQWILTGKGRKIRRSSRRCSTELFTEEDSKYGR
ncbi:hypothetical protein ADUPG1_007321, partial [Aduncisulcus paluster]